MLGKRVIKFERLKILYAGKTGFRRLGHMAMQQNKYNDISKQFRIAIAIL